MTTLRNCWKPWRVARTGDCSRRQHSSLRLRQRLVRAYQGPQLGRTHLLGRNAGRIALANSSRIPPDHDQPKTTGRALHVEGSRTSGRPMVRSTERSVDGSRGRSLAPFSPDDPRWPSPRALDQRCSIGRVIHRIRRRVPHDGSRLRSLPWAALREPARLALASLPCVCSAAQAPQPRSLSMAPTRS